MTSKLPYYRRAVAGCDRLVEHYLELKATRRWESMSGSYGIFSGDVHDGAHPVPHPVVPGASTQWFAVETRHRFEKKVAAQLAYRGFRVFLPLRNEVHAWSDRLKTVALPLFPGYAFVQVDRSRDSWQAVLRTAGLIRFVNFGGIMVAVPPKQIEDLELLQREKERCVPCPFVPVGQRVRVRGGCLHGLEGMLAQHEEKKLVISIQSIQRSVAVEIEGYELELV